MFPYLNLRAPVVCLHYIFVFHTTCLDLPPYKPTSLSPLFFRTCAFLYALLYLSSPISTSNTLRFPTILPRPRESSFILKFKIFFTSFIFTQYLLYFYTGPTVSGPSIVLVWGVCAFRISSFPISTLLYFWKDISKKGLMYWFYGIYCFLTWL